MSQDSIFLAVLLGILLIAVPALWIQSDVASEQLLERTQTAVTKATITSTGYHGVVYWQFTLAGKVYDGDSNQVEEVKPGDLINVRYNPQDPSQNSFGDHKPMTFGGYIVVSGMIDFFILGSSLMLYGSIQSKLKRPE
jgi:hypothetical protein